MRSYECSGDGGLNAAGVIDHCCYVDGDVCDYLVVNVAGRRFACGLMLKYGSWDAVVSSTEYRPIGLYWRDTHPGSLPFNYCQSFDPAFCCRPEFRYGRHNEDAPLPAEV